MLSNHLHLVLRTTPRLVKRMGDWEIARRWLRVFPGHRVLDGNWIEPTEEQVKADGKIGSADPAADGWLAPLTLAADHLGDLPSVTDRSSLG